MSERFKKLKRKYLLGAILKSAVCGLSFGLFVAGVVLLSLKLSAISLDVVWYVLMGAGAAVLGCVVAFIFFRPTNKKVATDLDNEFGLEERVQTSLEYGGQEGTILEMQRADTEKRLSGLPKRKLRFSKIWQFCVTAVIAVAIAVTAIFIPAKQASASGGGGGGDDDPDANITKWQLSALSDIIENVKNDLVLDDAVKNQTVPKLEDLKDKFSVEGIKQKQLEEEAAATIAAIEGIHNGAVSYLGIASALKQGKTETDAVFALGDAVLRGGNSYRTSKIMDYPDVEKFLNGTGAENDDSDSYHVTRDKMTVSLQSLIENLHFPPEEENEEETEGEAAGDELLRALQELLQTLDEQSGGEVPEENPEEAIKQALDGLHKDIDTVLNALKELDGEMYSFDDDVYSQLADFGRKVSQLSSNIDNDAYSDVSELKSAVVSVLSDMQGQLAIPLAKQSYVGAMRRYICNRLRYVFDLGGFEEADSESSSGGQTGGKPNQPPEENPGDGPGTGGGGHKYASDDMVYDPRTGTYKKYGEILKEYEAMLDEYVRSGALTPEQEKMARDYFERLQ